MGSLVLPLFNLQNMETMTMNESALELLEMMGLDADSQGLALDTLAKADSRYLRDMKMNLKTAMSGQHLNKKEVALLGLAAATNEKSESLMRYFRVQAIEAEASAEELAEAIACASLLSANNVFYRFRHFTGKDEYQQQPARLRMSIMMNPATGKEFFELMSLAVSAVNGCQACVNSHEASLMELSSTPERVFEAVRLVSVIVSLTKIIH